MKSCIYKNLAAVAVAVCSLALASCGNEDNGGDKWESTPGAFFLSVSGEKAEYIMQAEDLERGQMLIGQNIKELQMSGYTWIFNRNPSVAIGLIYNQGDPGIGLAYGASTSGALNQLGEFQISSRFTSYGFCGDYAITSVGGKTPVDASGNALLLPDGEERTDGVTFNTISLNNFSLRESDIITLDITGNGEQATLSGIVDLGDGTFMTGLVCSQPQDESATGGSSSGTVTYPDSCWVAVFDTDFNLKKIYRDGGRISYSAGRYRSQYYSQIGQADDGTTYVFSGSYDYNNTATTRPCGAIRINKGANDFDQEYYFNIEALSNQYRFRKVWHITGDHFLLEFYNHQGRLTAITDPATQYAVVDVKDQTLKWVGGEFPGKDEITSTGTPMAYKGKMYFPATAEGVDPTIYVIDPATGLATAGLSVRGATSINSVGRLIE